MKKLLCLLLTFLMCVLSLASCKKPSETTTTDTKESIEMNIDLSLYKIVRPAEINSTYSKSFVKFCLELNKKTGLSLELVDDSDNEQQYEILLQNTNRTQSADIMKGISSGYAIRYIDSKIVIQATSLETMNLALEKFMSYITDGSIISLPIDYSAEVAIDEKNTDVLRNLTFNAIGDSYFAASGIALSQSWLSLMANELGMKMNNYGIGGSTVSDYEDHNAMVNRYMNMERYANIIIVEGGRNDYNVRTPLGELEERNSKTFAGALNIMIDGLKEKYPNAMIVGITCWYVNSDQKKYSDMMLDVFENQGLACFNAADQDAIGVYMTDANFRKKYCIGENDVSHLNAEGMKLVMPVFRDWIANEYVKFTSK